MAMNTDHKDVNDTALELHNKLRALHHSPKLEIDWKLARSAQAYAEKLAKTDAFAHSDNKGQYGENLASSYNSREGYVFSGTAATQNWYDEIKDYKFEQESQQTGKIGHFSQVVWRDTKLAGFGRAKTAGGKYIIVGQYKPPGNYIGRFKENVAAPSGAAPARRKDDVAPKTNAVSTPQTVRCCGCITNGASKSTRYEDRSTERPKPVIGPNSKNDQMIKSSTKTTTVNGRKTVLITETYQTPEGKTYDKSKTVTSKA